MSNELRSCKTIQDIRDAFSANKISAREAATLLGDSKIKKPWHTKEWRVLRASLLGDECTQCGSQDKPFVLQHTWQPRKLSEIARDIRHEFRLIYEAAHPMPEIDQPEPEKTRDGCPSCCSISIYWRKTTQDWRCSKTQCKAVFKNPAAVPVLSAQQYDEWSAKQKEAKQAWYEQFREDTEEQVLSEALPMGFQEHDRYLTCKDTTTFCVKCAFMWDKRGKKLCTKCKSFIPVHISEDQCFTCLDNEFGGISDYLESLYETEAARSNIKE